MAPAPTGLDYELTEKIRNNPLDITLQEALLIERTLGVRFADLFKGRDLTG